MMTMSKSKNCKKSILFALSQPRTKDQRIYGLSFDQIYSRLGYRGDSGEKMREDLRELVIEGKVEEMWGKSPESKFYKLPLDVNKLLERK
jgi:hypothetical protein